MVQPIQIQGLKSNIFGQAAGTTGQLASALMNLVGQQNRSLDQTLRTGIQQFAAGRRQKKQLEANQELENIRQQGLLERTELGLPSRFATQANALFNAAAAAEQAGNFSQAQRLRQQAGQIAQGAVGGVGELVGSQPAPTGQAPIPQQADLNQEAQAADPVTPAGVANIGGQPTQLPIPTGATPLGTKAISEASKKQADAFIAQVNVNDVQSFERAQQAPDGSILKGDGNKDFIGLKINDGVRSLLQQGAREKAISPNKSVETSKLLSDEIPTLNLMINSINNLSKFEGIDKTGFFNVLGKKITDTGLEFIDDPAVELLGGINKSKLRAAEQKQDVLDGLVNGLAKQLQKGGVVTEEDAAQARKLIPSISDNSRETFEAKQKALVDLMIPKAIDSAIRVGDATGANKLQKLYREATGNFYQPGNQVEQSLSTKESAVNFNLEDLDSMTPAQKVELFLDLQRQGVIPGDILNGK